MNGHEMGSVEGVPTGGGRSAALHRLASLREAMREAGIDALVASSPENRFYLTGLDGWGGHLLVGLDAAWAFTDKMFAEELAAANLPLVIETPSLGVWDAMAQTVRSNGIGVLAVEAENLSHAEFEQLTEAMARAGATIDIRGRARIVEGMRARKGPGEIACIEEALRIAEEALERIVADLRPGVSEKEVAMEIEYAIRRLGGEKAAFDTIVAFGERSSRPHAKPSERRLGMGEPILVDLGAVVGGYCSDLSRSFVLGRVDGRLREIYRIIEEAQQAAFLAIKAGAGCREVDLKAREVLEKAGYGDRFIHGLGHGVGLQVHEFPRMSRWAPEESKLDAGMVVTVEPGVYIPGFGGIRLEDMVAVTEGGCRVLTRFPKVLEMVNR